MRKRGIRGWIWALLLICWAGSVSAETTYTAWRHSASLFILTTPEGANLPASAVVQDFPLLVRLNKDCFDFTQAAPHGEDIRFSSAQGEPLAYQIEAWDAAQGDAVLWVRIPKIQGNARQEIRMHWGQKGVTGESNGAAVFNASNGFASVWHLTPELRDEVGTLTTMNRGTSDAPGRIGWGRHFGGGQGIFCGDKIPDYPSGGAAHSTEAWFRAEQPNATLIGWGNEGGGRGSKVRMQFRSPPHIHIDSDFSDVNGEMALPVGEWVHVVHTYENGIGRIYINGKLDSEAKTNLNIKTPSRMWIGGWYDQYDFVGEIDEVRISRTARSADWIHLEYENQKPMQTLVGPPVRSGNAFAVTPTRTTIEEGRSATFTAIMQGAQKIYWSLIQGGRETVVAVDQSHFTLEAGRVTGDAVWTLRCRAIYPEGIRTQEMPITIREAIPDPIFTLQTPARWDGRSPLLLTPDITNLAEMQVHGAGELHYSWSVSGIATIRETSPGKLLLKRAQNSGRMTVRLALDNGGAATVQTIVVQVQEPGRDAWIAGKPGAREKPEENQFYARDDSNTGTLACNGDLKEEQYPGKPVETADAVYLKVYAENHLFAISRQKLNAGRTYALTAKLKPGLVHYRVEFGILHGKGETLLRSVGNIVCGDVYLIDGQSNAEATAWGSEEYTYTSEWIRTFGSPEGSPEGANLKLWGNAVARSPGGKLQIGYWGMELARRLMEAEKIPICILNGAVGGTRIDQHQRSVQNPEDPATIYGRLLHRVKSARLTHGVRGILWHQGENDQGADGPTGGYGWETYQQYFIDLAADWKEDYPNVQHYYMFQIWPKACAMGINGSDNRLREVQRQLPSLFSHLSIMSTLGIQPPGGCHYPPEGYAEMARLIFPLVERNNYGRKFRAPITPPNLKQAFYSDLFPGVIALVFDQPVVWSRSLLTQFMLDGKPGSVRTVKASGNVLLLLPASPETAHTITYLDSKAWSEQNLLRGSNGIAALTFCDVPILSRPPR